MKTLWLLRHGEALPKESMSGTDKARVLSEQGQRQAQQQGLWLKEQAPALQLALISPATRTQETAKLCLAHLNLSAEQIKTDDRIYNSDIDTLMDIIKEQDDIINTLLICGHNPGISVLASILGQDGYFDMQPATLCKLELAIDHWSQLKNRVGNLVLTKLP